MSSVKKPHINNIAVFCGSRPGHNPSFSKLARKVGAALARDSHPIIYGGGLSGLMGSMAQGALESGGTVQGITVSFLNAAQGDTPMGAVNQIESSMQSRLHIMIELCDAAVFLPGGFGTLEEASSLLVRNDLSNICRDNIRPLIFVNHHGFFDPLLGMFDRFIAEGFVPPERKRFIHSVDSPEALIDKVRELNSVAPLTSRDMTMKHAEATGMFNINQPR